MNVCTWRSARLAVGVVMVAGTLSVTAAAPARAHHSSLTGVSVMADGKGYALVTSLGEVYAYGNVVYRGNPTGFSGSIVDISVTADGQGYVAVSSAGQVYAFGTAVYRGNPTGFSGSMRGIAVRPDGQGYVAVSSAGQVYAYNVTYRGNPTGFTGSIVDISVTNSGAGYVAISSAGQVYAYNAVYHGNVTGYSGSVSGVSVTPDGQAYIAVSTSGTSPAYPTGHIIWQHQWASAYGYWNWNVSGDTWNVDQNIQILQKARESYWAGQWRWRDLPHGDDGAYAGLLTTPDQGDLARFSIWNTKVANGPNCRSFTNEGDGMTCTVPYPIATNRLYRLRIWRLHADSGGQWWGAYVLDQSTGVDTWIGDIRAPFGATSVSDYMNFSEYYGKQMLLPSYVPQSIVDFTQPGANSRGGGVYDGGGTFSHGHVNGGTTGNVQHVDYGWTRAARITMGG